MPRAHEEPEDLPLLLPAPVEAPGVVQHRVPVPLLGVVLDLVGGRQIGLAQEVLVVPEHDRLAGDGHGVELILVPVRLQRRRGEALQLGVRLPVAGQVGLQLEEGALPHHRHPQGHVDHRQVGRVASGDPHHDLVVDPGHRLAGHRQVRVAPLHQGRDLVEDGLVAHPAGPQGEGHAARGRACAPCPASPLPLPPPQAASSAAAPAPPMRRPTRRPGPGGAGSVPRTSRSPSPCSSTWSLGRHPAPPGRTVPRPGRLAQFLLSFPPRRSNQ